MVAPQPKYRKARFHNFDVVKAAVSALVWQVCGSVVPSDLSKCDTCRTTSLHPTSYSMSTWTSC